MDDVHPSQALPASKGRRVPAFRRLGAFLCKFRRSITEPWLRRAAIAELQGLSTRELRDAGIEPYEIDTLVDDMLAAKRRDEEVA